MRTALSLGVGLALALSLVAPAALAQDGALPATPPAGDGALPPPKVTTQVNAAPTTSAPKAAEEDTISDHEKVVGHFGVGYMGLSTIPLAGGNGIPNSVNAPVVGVRYWLSEKLGLDLGLGFGLASGSREVVNGATTTVTDSPSVFGFAVHAGVPLVLGHQKHFMFLAIPELNLGIASAKYQAPAQGAAVPQPEVSHSGFLLGLGGRIGAEIQFGFIGIPQLSLQGSVGLGMQYKRVKTSAENNGVTVSDSSSSTDLRTSVQSDPWALFTNTISAIYYVP